MSSARHFPALRVRAFLSAFLFGFLFLGGLTTCGSNGATDSPEITVVVDVAGLTPDITSLFVTSALNGGQAQASPEVTGRLAEFAIALPLTTSGHLTISVVGRSAEHCVVASGQAAVDVQNPPTRYQVSINLGSTAGAAKSCTLTLNVLGKGTITSNPPGLQCVGAGKLSTPTTCSYDFPVGTTIALSTSADPKIYGTTYSGLCTGTTDCSVNFSAPGTITAGIANRVCSTGSWCWHNPLPQGNTLRAIWGVATNDIWAVGDAGTIMHYDGATWSAPAPIGAATTQDLYAIYGTGPTDIWAAGAGGFLIHWDGTAWTNSNESGIATTQILRGVWGSGKDYWAVGYNGAIVHYDGQHWSAAAGSGQVTTASLYGIWGSAAGDIWAVGTNSVIIHYNGMAWAADAKSGTLSPPSFGNSLSAVSGTGQGNVWAAGYYYSSTLGKNVALVLHYDGTTWSLGPTAGVQNVAYANTLWNTSNTSVWIGGYAQTPMSSSASAHYDGTAWTTQTALAGSSQFYGIWGSSDSDIWAVGPSGFLSHWNGQAWAAPPLVTATSASASLYSVWANSVNDVWAVGGSGLIRHFDGNQWTNSAQSGVSTMQPLYRVFGTSPSNVMAVGSGGTLLQYANNVWSTPVPYATNPKTDFLLGLWGGTASTIWAVGYNGALATYSYNSTTMVSSLNGYVNSPVLTTNFRGIWGTSSSNMYAVGLGGAIYHSYGGLWSVVTSPVTNDLYGIWGALVGTTTTAWAVGSSGTVLRFNGTTWLAETFPTPLTTSTLSGVWSSPTNQVWASGSAGALIHYDGTTWSNSYSGTHLGLNAIWGVGLNDIWTVGDAGTTLRYQP